MQPLILQWKAALALLGVLAVGVTLGSVLGPPGRTQVGGNELIVVGPTNPKLCAQGRVRGRLYHVLGYKQSEFRFSDFAPSPVPPDFLPGPCPAR